MTENEPKVLWLQESVSIEIIWCMNDADDDDDDDDHNDDVDDDDDEDDDNKVSDAVHVKQRCLKHDVNNETAASHLNT